MPVTTNDVEKILERDDGVERAIVALYRLQTEDEKATRSTSHTNGVGFNSRHARDGAYFARWILNGNHLTGRFLVRARNMAYFYKKQLLAIATANEMFGSNGSSKELFKLVTNHKELLLEKAAQNSKNAEKRKADVKWLNEPAKFPPIRLPRFECKEVEDDEPPTLRKPVLAPLSAQYLF